MTTTDASAWGAGHALPTAETFAAAAAAWQSVYEEKVQPRHYDQGQLPVLDPVTWRAYHDHEHGRQRPHHPSQCEVCAYWSRLDAEHYASPWLKRHRVQGLRPRWPSAEAALEHYWVMVRDGYPAGSVTGTLVQFGKMGCWTQQGGRKGSHAERAADDVVAVEGAIRYAYRQRQRWRPYAAILLARRGTRSPVPATEIAEALGMLPAQVAHIVRTGMRGVRVELAARGCIPAPRRDSRLYEETARRGEVLCATG